MPPIAPNQPVKIPYPTEGIIRSAQLDDTVTPENSVQIAVNMNFDRIGAMQTRPGITEFADNLGGQVDNFGTLNILNGVKRLYAQDNTLIRNWNGATWTTRRTLSTGANKARFDQYLNQIWMVNGNNSIGGDPVQISSGGNFSAPTTAFPGLTNALPEGDFIQAGFNGRVWTADASEDVVYFTDIVQFTPPSTYDLSFDPTRNFIKTFSSQDGESITGLKRTPRALLVFKQNHIYRIYGAYSSDPYPAYNVGTYSQESIVQTKDGLYFHHSSGFYKFTYDGQPTEISRRVIDFVRAIPRSNYEDVVGVWDGFDCVKWSVGAVTVEGVTYQNCMMRYTISTQVWTIYDYVGNNISALVLYDDGTNQTQVAGTTTGIVAALDSGTTDLGEPIYFEMIDRWRSFLELYSKTKVLSGMMVSSDNGAGTNVFYQVNKDSPNVWQPAGTLDDSYASLFPNFKTENDFNRFRYRLSGNTIGEPIVFHGTEFMSLSDEGFDKN